MRTLTQTIHLSMNHHHLLLLMSCTLYLEILSGELTLILYGVWHYDWYNTMPRKLCYKLDTYTEVQPQKPQQQQQKTQKKRGGDTPPKLRQNRTVEQFRFLPHLNLSEYRLFPVKFTFCTDFGSDKPFALRKRFPSFFFAWGGKELPI